MINIRFIKITNIKSKSLNKYMKNQYMIYLDFYSKSSISRYNQLTRTDYMVSDMINLLDSIKIYKSKFIIKDCLNLKIHKRRQPWNIYESSRIVRYPEQYPDPVRISIRDKAECQYYNRTIRTFVKKHEPRVNIKGNYY